MTAKPTSSRLEVRASTWGLFLRVVLLVLTVASPAFASTVPAHFSSASDVPITAAGYTATGNEVDLSLGFVPSAGTRLMIVNNTGLAFIAGRFGNLGHGQLVDLPFEGKTYRFVANYYGGTGNDLVLEWAFKELYSWGDGFQGKLGNGTSQSTQIPARVATSAAMVGKIVISVSARGRHTVALCSDGTLLSWGYNGSGQLGNGETENGTTPGLVDQSGVLAGKEVIAISAGASHSLVLCSDGSLFAWGANTLGQLGNGNNTDSPVPLAVSMTGALTGKSVVAISAGDDHNLALCSDGTVVAWGSNDRGRLGNGSTENSNVPVAVNRSGFLATRSVVSIAAGGEHSLVLCSDGKLASWGANYFSQLGKGSAGDSSIPVAVDMTGVLAGKTVTHISAGYLNSLICCSDGTVASTGYDQYGELGNGSALRSSWPVSVVSSGVLTGKTVVGVTSAYQVGFALCSDGTLAAWGWNSAGQLGQGGHSDSNEPVLVDQWWLQSGKSLDAVAGGYQYSVALASRACSSRLESLTPGSGTLAPGKLEDFDIQAVAVQADVESITLNPVSHDPAVIRINGTEVPSGTESDPIPLVPGNNLINVEVTGMDGGVSTYVVTVVRALALNATIMSGAEPAEGYPAFDATGLVANISLGYTPETGSNLMILKNTGLDFIKGRFTNLEQGQRVILSQGGHGYAFVVNYYGGSGNDLVLEWPFRKVISWGSNTYGQLGVGGTGQRLTAGFIQPGSVLEGKTVLKVSTGREHSLALCSDGTIAAWGGNSYGCLGDGTATNRSTPVLVDGSGVLAGKTVIDVSAGSGHSLALCSDGTVAVWGSLYLSSSLTGGALNSVVPFLVPPVGDLAGRTVISVHAGKQFSLLRCSDGSLVGWGNSSYGVLGNGSDYGSSFPTNVRTASALAGKIVTQLAVSGDHALALCSDGSLAAWGYNSQGQLGDSLSPWTVYSPINVDRSGILAGKSVMSVACGGSHSLALCSDGTLAGWGANVRGQIGDDIWGSSPVPIEIRHAGSLTGMDVISLQGGANHSVALCADGRMVAWGSNASNALGNQTTLSESRLPMTVLGNPVNLGKPLALAATSSDHTLGITAFPPDTNLASLTFGSIGTLSPGFQPDVKSYAFSVQSSVDSTTITPVAGDSSCIMTVNGTVVPSGAASAALPLAAGTNPVSIVITALDGSSTEYVVNIVRPADVHAVYLSESQIPVSCPTFDATGLTADLSLGCVPSAGSELMVVENTGIDFIKGEFTNLTQGQLVSFSFNGAVFRFVVNYFGGSGNDLVLEWADRQLVSWGNNASGQLGLGTNANGVVPAAISGTGALSGKFVMSIAAGSLHSLALCSDGTLISWGDNTYGQLGNGGTVSSLIPIAVDMSGVLSGRRVVAVSAGDHHSLALCSDGTVVGWGRNSNGQLGDGSNSNRNVPVNVETAGLLALKKVVSISAGASHSLGLCSDGTVIAWGSNSGRLGDGGTASSNIPVSVSREGTLLGKTVISVESGGSHGLVCCSDGTMAAWGFNTYGQLGNGYTLSSLVPVPVDTTGTLSGEEVAVISAGGLHNVVLSSKGVLASWGCNTDGQLGSGTLSSRSVPVAVNQTGVLLGKPLVSVSAGGSHSLALCSDGFVAAWGDNDSGQLGNGSLSDMKVPGWVNQTGVLSGKRVVRMDAGSAHSLVLAAVPPNSKLASLTLSSGTLSRTFSPDFHDYAAKIPASTANVTVTPTTQSRFATVQVNGVDVESGTSSGEIPLPVANNLIEIVVTGDDGCPSTYTISTDAEVNFVYSGNGEIPFVAESFDATGWTANLALGFSPPVGTNLTVVDNRGIGFITGELTNLAQGQMVELAYNGVTYQFVVNYFGGTGNDLVLEWAHRRILSWGTNSYGQLGIGSAAAKSLVPAAVIETDVLAGNCVLQVVGGWAHGLALSANGTIAAWGDVSYSGAVSGSNVPVATNLGSLAGKHVVAISAANMNNLALCSDGTVSAWGYGGYGQLGNGSTTTQTTPVAVDTTGVLNGYSVVAISSGGTHCLALRSDGKVVAWGRNDQGQLGDGSLTTQTTPVLVRTTSGALKDKTVIAIATGYDHSLALCSDGTLAAWGNNSKGQLGNGIGGDSTVPVSVDQTGALAGKTVTALSHGAEWYSVVVCSDGTVAAWGDNGSGQLGNGSSSSASYVPVAVDHTGSLSGKTVVSVSSGYKTNVAVCSDGSVVTWGLNFYGSLGDGTTVSMSRVPVAVTSTGELHGRKVLSAGVGFQCHVIAAEPASGYIAWMSGQSGVVDKTDFADPDSDGIPNLVEYALHGDPATFSTTILPTISAGGDDFIFNFNRLASSAADTTQIFEWSPDLVSWTPMNVGSNPDSGVVVGSVDGNGQQDVTVTVPKGANSRMFGRLSVSRP